MQPKATLHVHPSVADIDRIIEVRRLAQELGCRFVSSSHLRLAPSRPANGPWGGDAA